ncbi:membrane insertase OXA1 [Aspergillus alliaceus]|uniref:membrane insertase OXA1 n=1 Tax=Petromyces alliaceus TaxID=209559 RepID=UPI0012A6ACE9|nr:60Kd inner membrane protein-domain-containing protein [Aspergillus alliaceus]KAB8234694.1 60Kd inner membrane protein-domain-containing protein [Aspergillus alliaceus]
MMLGGAGLKGRGIVPAIARQRLTARLMSSFRSQASGFPAQYGRSNQSLAGNLSWRPVSSVHQVLAPRFNSTASAPAAAAAAATTSDAVGTTTAPAPASDLSDFDINAIPEKIGYLKELGLDYGWGFSSTIEYFIEHFHIWGGLPWWASIVGTGLLIRLALLKPMLAAADVSAKINNVKPLVAPIRARMTAFAREGKTAEAMQARAEVEKIHADHNINAYKSFIPLIQVPFGFGCYRVVKGMTALPVPGLAAESVGWIKDLTVADPYFLLPATTAFAMYLSFKKGGESGLNEMSKSPLGMFFLYGMPAISFAFMSFFPSALQLYFLSTGLFALGQAYLVSSTSFRKFANIAIPNKPATLEITPEEQKRSIRMLEEAIQSDKRDEVIVAKPGQDVSFVDRTIDNVKKSYGNLTNDMKEKIDTAMGNEPKKNADGSLAETPRLSEKDRKLAADYEQRRKEEDDWKREERNHARRIAHLRALELEREKARSAYKNSKQR